MPKLGKENGRIIIIIIIIITGVSTVSWKFLLFGDLKELGMHTQFNNNNQLLFTDLKFS